MFGALIGCEWISGVGAFLGPREGRINDQFQLKGAIVALVDWNATYISLLQLESALTCGDRPIGVRKD